jgi:OFA family oxalate/formate antiporter-like MFS transporter
VAERSRAAVFVRENLPWPVIHGAAMINFVCFGCAYAMVVLSPFVHQDIALQPWQLTTLFSVAGGIYYTLGGVSGRLSDRFGARPVVRAGMMLLLVSLVLASQTSDSTLFGLLYLAGIGFGVGLCFVPIQVAVQVHAGRHASLAAGLASSGIGVGVMAVPPACSLLLGHIGWRPLLAGLAVMAMLGLVAARPMVAGTTRRRTAERPTAVVRSMRFTMLYIANLGIGLVVFVPMANIVPYAISKGLPGREAALMLALVGSGSIIGRLLFGIMGEYTGARRASMQCALLIAVSFLALALRDSVILLHFAMLTFGMGYGGVFGLMAPTTAEVMGMRHFGGVLGTLTTSRAVGIVFGPTLTAILASLTASYEAPYLICAAIAAGTAGLFHAEAWTRLPVPLAEPAE